MHITPIFIPEVLSCSLRTAVQRECSSESNALYSDSLLLIGWFL